MTLAPLVTVVRRLGARALDMVFVGGMVRPLHITDPGAPPTRVTDDVDAIVAVASRVDYERVCNELRSLGFRVDSSPDAPVCRWIADGIKVDFMPTDEKILGFRNRWYEQACAHAIRVRIEDVDVRIASAVYFCATKLDAFSDRGKGDYLHHDLEDFIAVVDGRAELVPEVAVAAEDVRRYLANEVRALLATQAFVDALPGQLAGDAGSQARLGLVTERLRALADLNPHHEPSGS
jgi:predicted nucleotidyltransferase